MAWVFLASGAVVVALLLARWQMLPDPLPANAREDRFSAERAMRVLRHMTDEIGMRPNGTKAHLETAEYLAEELRAMPRVEAELQKVSGVQQYSQVELPFPPFVYTTVNVVRSAPLREEREGLDGGPRGKPVIIRAGRGNAWLIREYGGAVSAPAATVIGEGLIDAGFVPHNGDFRPFHDAGLIGIDVAPLADFWAIHTDRDTASRIDASTLQLVGDNVLDATRALAASELPGDVDHTRPVHYDLLSLGVLVYSPTVAAILAVIALVLVAVALVLAFRRGALTLKQAAGGLGRTLLALAVALSASSARSSCRAIATGSGCSPSFPGPSSPSSSAGPIPSRSS